MRCRGFRMLFRERRAAAEDDQVDTRKIEAATGMTCGALPFSPSSSAATGRPNIALIVERVQRRILKFSCPQLVEHGFTDQAGHTDDGDSGRDASGNQGDDPGGAR